MKDFNGELTANSIYNHKINGDWFDSSIGITKLINGKRRLYFEGAYQLGDEFDNLKLNGGYRHLF